MSHSMSQPAPHRAAESNDPPRPPANASPPTIRRLTGLALSVFAVLALVSLVALVGGSAVLRQAMDTVTRDTRSAMLASELEAAVLMHQRLSNLHVMTEEDGIDQERRNVVLGMRRMLEEAERLVGATGEQQVLDEVAARLDAYLLRRAAAENYSRDLPEVVQTARPAFNEVLGELRSLRALNDVQVERARVRALRVNRLATWVGASAAVLLIAGFVTIGWGMRRYLLRPVIALYRAMQAFRGGAPGARSDGGGVREVHELARMFDEMAESLVQQRQAQLTFVAGVAHDLRNPLSTLKTGLYVLAHEPSAERRADTRATLDGQVDLLNRMADDLLDATRIEAGQLELRPARFDLGRLVRDLVDQYRPGSPDHTITARLPDRAVNVRADALRIEQVIRNLLSNALKFSPEGGPIEVSVVPGDAGVILSVSDHGIGIAAEDQADIFLPFRRRRLSAAPGAGLGLSVVRRIVTAHGGTVEVQSEPGVGSTFQVTLPAGPADTDLG